MDRNTEITLDALYDAIKAAIQERFPEFVVVEDHPTDRKPPNTPACFFEMTEMIPQPDIDPGTEQTAFNASFEAELLISFRGEGTDPTVNPLRQIRTLAGDFAAFTRLQRWGLPVGPAYPTGAYKDDFQPELDRYEVWRVEWEQIIHLGKSVWNDDGTVPVPGEVRASQFPRIGNDFVDEYSFLNEPPTDD